MLRQSSYLFGVVYVEWRMAAHAQTRRKNLRLSISTTALKLEPVEKFHRDEEMRNSIEIILETCSALKISNHRTTITKKLLLVYDLCCKTLILV